MPELQVDVTVANRFISSLSKSLQALCHGCMDFDSGIEIVGYININIDSGSKVDYVLNEKVLKSTTNSMTFVSNSFLAKKEQPKQMRDGSCSPVPELQVHSSPYPPHPQGAHMGSQYHRFAHQFSPHPRAMRGSQKRSWTGDWRMNAKRQRLHMAGALHHGGQHSQSTAQTTAELGFKQPQIPTATETGASDSNQQLVNVKKELEADNGTQQSEHSTSQDEPFSSGKQETSSDILSKIKSDPDAVPSNDDPGTSEENATRDDTKESFLLPQTTQDPQQSEQESTDRDIGGETSEQFLSDPTGEETDDQSASGNVTMTESSDVPYDSEQGGSDMPEEFAQGADEGSYSQSAYSDLGEGSSDAGQFEVIEIDDEDEDVQAMLNDPHGASSAVALGLDTSGPHPHLNIRCNSSLNTTASRMAGKRNELKEPYFILDDTNQLYSCTACGKQYRSSSGARLHYKIKHCGYFDHYCQICGKGFQQKSHLKSHMSLHMQRKDFKCTICGALYAHKTSLTAHQKLLHGVFQNLEI